LQGPLFGAKPLVRPIVKKNALGKLCEKSDRSPSQNGIKERARHISRKPSCERDVIAGFKEARGGGLCPESFVHLWRHVEGKGRFVVGSFVGYFVEVYGRE
jgi:hypothetical protein